MTFEKAIEYILKEQINTYRMLRDILKKERTCLVNIDAEEIEEISKEKDTTVMRLRLLEEERQRLTTKFVIENGLDNNISLNDLGKLTGNNMLLELRSQMISLLQSIEEMNQFNSSLIDRSINYIKNTTNFISTFSREDNTRTTGVLLSKET